MQNGEVGKYTTSFGLSFAITAVFSALLVVVKELSPGLLDAMKKATSHHWITHGVVDIILFVGLGFLFAQMNGGSGVQVSSNKLIRAVVTAVILGWVIISGFYLLVD